jgi:hypothetical protein
MYANVDDFDKKINLYTEDCDLCYLCSHLEVCPLLAALQDEAVVLRYESIEVEKCGMFKEFSFDQMIAF